MSNRLSFEAVKCPNCGGLCEPYDEDLFICESCGTLVDRPAERKIIEIRNRAKVERIRFEVQQYQDKMAAEEAEHELMRAYANMPFFKKIWFHASLAFEEFFDWFRLNTGRNLLISALIVLAVVVIIYLTGK